MKIFEFRQGKVSIDRSVDAIQKNNKVILPVIFVLQAFLLMSTVQCITFADSYILSEWFRLDNFYYLIYNFFLYLMLVLACYILFKRILISYLVSGTLSVLLSVINNMKWTSLKECITLSDFSKLSEAFKVAGRAEFHVSYITWIGVFVSVISIFIWLYFDIRLSHTAAGDKMHIRTCRIFLIVLCSILFPFLIVDMKNSEFAKLTEARTADQTGPLVYFFESILTVSQQEEYTEKEALDSYRRYVEMGKSIWEKDSAGYEEDSACGEEQYPNIIVIMSEAFYDLNLLQGPVSYSENPMAAFEEIKEESSYGNTMVNVYGGSTHFSEFEFLTGWNTKGMNSGSCPYKEYFSENQPSLARYLKEKGYYTMAIHPYSGSFWNRYGAYPRMDFDKFVDRSQMKYTDMCGYISDDALTNEIIYQYEKKQKGNQPFFCFGVSIANHIAIINGEEKENVSEDINVVFHGNETGYGENKRRWFQEYVSGIAKSGEALKKLAEYFEAQEEPAVIVFFGDHAPSYALDLLKAGKKEEALAYSTPYIIWDNFNMDTQQDVDMNVSFLSTYLLMKLHMPLPEQGYYNIALQSEYPIETRYIIQDKNGRYYQNFDKEEQEKYFARALDLKKQVNALLKNPKSIQYIWD